MSPLRLFSLTCCLILAPACAAAHAADKDARCFTFGNAWAQGYTAVPDTLVYSADAGYGFEPGEARRFSVRVPEGNYDVTITFGDPAAATSNTLRAETRRLVLEKIDTRPGEMLTRTVTVNVRTSQLPDGGQVRLKEREQGAPHWDDKLTLEFAGKTPGVRSVCITPAPKAVTVFILGDSTVTDQQNEPATGWGQMMPRFFAPGVAVANHAESGESLKSFRNARRLEKVLSQVKPGDYLLVQFGHNDQKPGPNHVEPHTTYKEELSRVIAAARERGATPVLVTSVHRRTFGRDGRIVNSHGEYPQAVRDLALEQKVALVDLHAMSARLYEALGVEGSKAAFMHYPAGTFPGQDQPLKDNSHFNAYGGYELARCVVEAIRTSELPLAKHLAEDVKPFDPSKPDPRF